MNRYPEVVRKHEVVFQDILTAIRCGKLTPGSKLPNEAELALRYSISRNSVRRGLMRLENEGLVEKRQGSGSYVLPKGAARATEDHHLALGVRYVPQSTESRIGHVSSLWWSLLRQGIEYGAAYHGLELIEEPRGRGVRFPVGGQPDEQLAGFLVAAFCRDSPADLMADLPGGVPRLLVNRRSSDPSIPSLSIDREKGAYRATSFLLALGHRRIAIDLLEDDSPPVLERERGYRRAFEAAGLPVDETMIFQGAAGSAYLEWPKRLHELLRRDRRPTALIMHHANRVLHIMEVLQSESIRVPQDVSLIIIDDDPALARMTPGVSAISEPYAEMGRRAVATIVDGQDGRYEASHVLIEPQLIMRESVIPWAPSDTAAGSGR